MMNNVVATLPPSARPIDMSDVAALKQKLLDEFEDVFDKEGPLKMMSGPPRVEDDVDRVTAGHSSFCS
jgi:hypothetical protein